MYGSKYRKKLWSGYKAERKTKTSPFDLKDYYQELDDTRLFLGKMGVLQGMAKYVEADDLIGWLAVKLSKEDKVVIVSNDKDFFQIPRKRIKLYRPIKDEVLCEEDIKDMFELPKSRDYAKILALVGDKDEVPGIFRLGPKTAIKILKEYDWNLTKLVNEYEKVFAVERDGDKKLLKDIEPSRKIAYRLARIRTRDAMYLGWERKRLYSTWRSINNKKEIGIRAIVQLSEILEFKSINLLSILKRIGVNIKKRKKK